MTIEEKIEICYEKQDNYFIKYNENRNGKCYVYFSSNALYKKDDIEDFTKKVIEKDRYEWTNLRAKETPEKEIFIRDIWLSWYVRGINSKINSYEKMIELVKELTKGYIVYCVGASSGGYIGNIIATQIGAEISYSFASQFSLRNHFNHLNENKYLRDYLKEYDDSWFEYYKKLNGTTVIYLYPMLSKQDQEQYDIIKNNECIITISVKDVKHGVALYPPAISSFLIIDKNKAKKLAKHKPWNKVILSIKLGGLAKFISFAIHKVKNKS